MSGIMAKRQNQKNQKQSLNCFLLTYYKVETAIKKNPSNTNFVV